MVVFLHVSAAGVSEFGEGWIYFNIYDSLVRACVPLFLMLSGALLLGRDEAVAVFYTKRFLRIFPPLIFWSIFYVVWKAWLAGDLSGVSASLLSVLKGPAYFHLWYLYALVGIYLFIPFMSKIYRNSTHSEKIAYLSIWFLVACVIPQVTYFYPGLGDLVSVYGLSSFMGLSGFVFLGAYAFDRIQAQTAPSLVLDAAVFVACAVGTALSTYGLSMHDGMPNQLFFSYLSPWVVVGSFFGFRLFVALGARLSRYAKTLNVLAGCTLGVYCLHMFVMNRLSLVYGGLIEGHSMLWIIPALVVSISVITLVPIFIARQFKPLRHII
ncbi:acyltransferase [Pseudomonas sp. B22129]|uniref:acyltransferase n=1 Tax=Pseudomonas sp. B22129 TaxID=3235111 RepID=UPI003784D608